MTWICFSRQVSPWGLTSEDQELSYWKAMTTMSSIWNPSFWRCLIIPKFTSHATLGLTIPNSILVNLASSSQMMLVAFTLLFLFSPKIMYNTRITKEERQGQGTTTHLIKILIDDNFLYLNKLRMLTLYNEKYSIVGELYSPNQISPCFHFFYNGPTYE